MKKLTFFILALILTFSFSLHTPDNVQARTKKTIELNFTDVEIRHLVEIMSKATGRAFIFDEKQLRHKKITLLSQVKYTKFEAYKIFTTILKINGLAIVEDGGVTRILRTNDAKRDDSAPLVKGKNRRYSSDSYVTRIISIKSGDINRIRSSLNPFISRTGTIQIYAPANAIIIRDTMKNTDNFLKMVRELDSKKGNKQLVFFSLKYADANTLFSFIKSIINQEIKENSFPSNQPYLIVEKRTNQIATIADPNGINKIRSLVQQLDLPISAEIKPILIPLKFAEANNISVVLNKVFGTSRVKTKLNGRDFTLIIPYPAGNNLLIIAREGVLDRIKKIIAELDQDSNTISVEIYPLKYAKSKDLASIVNKIFQIKFSVSRSKIGIFSEERTNSLILIGSNAVIAKITKIVERLDQPIKKENSSYRVYSLNSSSAKKVSGVLERLFKNNKRSKVNIIPDEGTNSLVIFAEPNQFNMLEKVLKDLDKVRPQVYVQALIMEMTLNKSLNLGVQWQGGGVSESNGAAVTVGAPQSSGVPTEYPGTASNGALVGVLGPTVEYNGKTYTTFSGFIKAMQEDTEIDILSKPSLMTMNNDEAEIKVGQVVPTLKQIVYDSNNNPSRVYDYKDVGVSLKIKPQINPDNSIRLEIEQTTNNVVAGAQDADGAITTLNRSVKTNILVKDGDTIALGGLISDSVSEGEIKTPCLGDIPGLGWAFKSKTTTVAKTNLMVFIKSKVVRTKSELKEVTELSSSNLNSANGGRFRVDVTKEFNLDIKKRRVLQAEAKATERNAEVAAMKAKEEEEKALEYAEELDEKAQEAEEEAQEARGEFRNAMEDLKKADEGELAEVKAEVKLLEKAAVKAEKAADIAKGKAQKAKDIALKKALERAEAESDREAAKNATGAVSR